MSVSMLRENGYCVIRVYSEEEVEDRHNKLKEALYNNMPEYLEGATLFVRGGFGALGNASSFHLPIVRQMRREAHRVATQFFKEFFSYEVRKEEKIEGEKLRLEQLIDRVRILRSGAEITQEVWHRDQTPRKKNPSVLEDDLIFGGWISLNGVQRFSAIKGSHKSMDAINNGNKGFSPLSAEECAKYTEEKNRALEFNSGVGGREKGGWYIEVPPGHMLIFQQELIHEVVGGKHKGEEQLRLFTGWRLTRGTQSFIKNPREFFVEQGVTNIKSDQTPDMYPDRPWSNSTSSRTGLSQWSRETFQPYLLEYRSVASGACAGETHQLVPKHMYSLYEVSLKKAAYRIKAQLEKELEEELGGAEEFFEDSEKQATYEAAKIMVESPPSVWEEMKLFRKPQEGPLVWETPYFDVDEKEDGVLFEAYTEEEMSMYSPKIL